MNTEKVMVGMSGGVDSSVAAKLLMDSGYEIAGATLELCEFNNDENINDAKLVCQRIGVPHFAFDLKKEFSHFVIDDFTKQYINGKTPNPCIECNKHIKFGKMIDLAIGEGYNKIATGHYARIKKDNNGRFLLLKAADSSKDQSYVLYALTQKALSRLLLPLGELSKMRVREIAVENDFINANRPDSQDICFVTDGDYAEFITKSTGFISEKGEYVDINGNVLGEHKGIIHYTLGQRKGLGVAFGKPQFVINKDAKTNRVVLGDEDNLYKTNVKVKDINLIPFDVLEGEMRVTAKLRYRHSAQPATIIPTGKDEIEIIFDKPQRAPSPGQAAVFYDGDIVVGGGIII